MSINSKSLMIIGGSGFFGKSILDCFKRGNLDPWHIGSIIVIARNASGLRFSHPELVENGVTLMDLDITQAVILPWADYVIHAAASTDSVRYQNNANEESENILRGVRNYCNLARSFQKDSHIVFCSSGAIYGYQDSLLGCLSEEYMPISMNELPAPKRAYAVAKQKAELEVRLLGSDGCKVSIARCFAFIGRYLPLNQHFAIGNFMNHGLKGLPITVNARHQVIRSYLYADDLVDWLMTIASKSSINCPVYNVGSEESVDIRALAMKVANYFDARVDVSEISADLVDRYIPCIEKAKEIGCKVTYSLDAAIEKTVNLLR
jgi:nucleoside-diphosphate-sugar epimerase